MAKYFLCLTAREWRAALLLSALVAGLVAVFEHFSVWIPITSFLTCLIIYHMAYASRFILPFPHIAILVSALQYVFAPWVSLYYPSSDPVFNIGADLPRYLAFAGPVILAVCAGWTLALWRLPSERSEAAAPSKSLLAELDLLVVVGFCASFVVNLSSQNDFTFVFQILSNLRYVGIFGRILVGGPGWRWRLALVFGFELLAATGSTMFHNVLLWCMWTAAVLVYRFRFRFWTMATVLSAIVVVLPALQFAKAQLRLSHATLGSENSSFGQKVERMFELGSYVVSGLEEMADEAGNDDFIADTVRRYNHGGIINRVMLIVPDLEPAAAGETLKDAALAAVFPRFVMPNKIQAGGQVHMLRFARMDVGETTSINLGYAGEMYANFPGAGGVIACGFYALAFGLAFRPICRRAATSPLWWALVPFVAFSALKAEEGIAEVLNGTVKSFAVALVISLFFPSVRRALLMRGKTEPGRIRVSEPAVP